MPNTVIALKKSATPSAAPAALANGELALNYADGKLYYKNTAGFIVEFAPTTSSNYFGTVNANSTLLVADTTNDILTIASGNNISIVGDAANDRLTISLANDVVIPGTFKIATVGNDEGGELVLGNAVTNSVLVGDIKIDVYQNKLRFFESGSPNRGAFINLAAASASVGTDLFATSSDSTARDWASSAFAKANAALPNTSGVTFNGNLTVSQNLSADRIFSTNNGNGENFKVGDDLWIGDTNLADTVRIKGQQNASRAYILFGDNDGIALGRQGSNALTYGANTIWHAGNDGAGSTLDADLLDGQHGSYYGIATDVTAAFAQANTARTVVNDTVNATRYLMFANGTSGTSSLNVAVGLTFNPSSNTLNINGPLNAVTKSFVINHPTKEDQFLRYGSLEGPENGVYVRGKLEGKSIIELPDYWWNLVDEETITVNLTPIGRSQDIWVQSTSAYFIHLNQPADCFFTVFAERKDVDKLVVEY